MNTKKTLEKQLSTRNIRDHITRIVVYLGGGSVLIALASMFVYLGYEVLPLFSGASIDSEDTQVISPADHPDIFLISLEEQNQITALFSKSGNISFYSNTENKIVDQYRVSSEIITSSSSSSTTNLPIYALGTAAGSFTVLQPTYKFLFSEDGNSKVIPNIEFPLGEALISNPHSDPSKPVDALALAASEDNITIVLKTGNTIALSRFNKEESFYGDDNTWEQNDQPLTASFVPNFMFVDQQQKNLTLISKDGRYSIIDLEKTLQEKESGQLLADSSESITHAVFLPGSTSIVIGTSTGRLSQWFPVRDENNQFHLTHIRDFQQQNAAITSIVPENSRKGFVVTTKDGNLSFIFATSNKVLYQDKLLDADSPSIVGISPRANAMMTLQSGKLSFYHVHNEHPEVSMSSLWTKVWYEGYPEPDYIWQSSSASSDFEPKFSFAPLVFGTIKAAFYAMLFALPIGILAGAYTAHFMAPAMRKMVKPTVEIMAALPTVILGFLAGLWLAPFIESHLTGIFTVPIVLLIGVVLLSLGWSYLPKKVRAAIPEGYEFAMLIPALILMIWGTFEISPLLELWLFGGDTRAWLTNDLGVNFDQRNSIIIGIAMGVAVIPNIFSITEDAVFSVPRSLTNGSLALGATPWQTMTRVVIQTASPAIFSAVMIGLGRAIGETMIVLMATGNTPIMNFNIFEGMRTLAANIAVEMPEAEVGSTHFRLLFMSAFTLFILTFVFNTLSEVVSHRLRKKFSSM